jgi:predicted metalloendopeptidase
MKSLAILASAALLAGALPAQAADAPASTPDSIAQQVLSSMDRKADPCVDFYQYACGGWMATTQRPPDRPRWVRSFSVIDERNQELLKEVLVDAGKNPGQDPDRQRVGNYYSSCMDEAAVEKRGNEPLASWLAEIAKVKDQSSLMALAGRMNAEGPWGPLLGLGVLADFKRPDTMIAFLSQGGLGMPDRDYYVSEDPKKKELAAAYGMFLKDVFKLLGENDAQAEKDSQSVVAFETELAKASRPRQEMRQVEKLYNKIDIDGLKKLTPGLDWDAFRKGLGRPDLQEINVATPEFFSALDKLVNSTSPEVLQTYLKADLARGAAPSLTKAWVDTNFEFYGKALGGQEENQPRWKRCVDATEGALGEAVGKLYIDKAFPGESKQVAVEMIRDIENAFERNLPSLAWMDETTRGRALGKKNALGNKIGYPDKFRDYSAMKIVPGDYFANVLASVAFEFKRQADKVGKPKDPSEWGMTPQMVNAYYNPLNNEIAFPAGILQPPFFNKDFPAAMNYGAIGMVVGHELTHGFDDQGRKFSPTGKLEEWWAPEVSKKFEERAKCVADQYSSFEVEPGVKVNGQLTLGENIADIGGLKQAYSAYKEWEKRHGGKGPTVGDLTPDQLFFVAHAQAWCSVQTPEFQRMQVTVDPHAPAKFRGSAPEIDNPAFAAAFSCKAGTPMNPTNRCEVW